MMARPGTIVNISGTTPVDDPEYRYKMPVVFGKIEGRGNGIKTVIPNLSEVAISLHRTQAEVNKFFGCELGAQTTYSIHNDRAVVNGSHTDVVLQNLIHRYIEIFVLCPQCCLPETYYRIKNGCIFHKCAACGNKEMIDMSHKLCTFILTQDKKTKKEKSKDKGKYRKDGDEKDRKKKNKDKDGSDDEKKKSKKEKKRKEKKRKEKKEKSLNNCNDCGYLENGIISQKEIDGFANAEDGISGSSEAGVDDNKAMNLAIIGIQKFMEDNTGASSVRVAEEIVNQQIASSLKAQFKVHIFVRAVITANFYKKKEFEKYTPIFQKITQENPIIERHLISAIEYICVDKPKNFPVMIKQLFDEDILQENVILEWAFDGRSDFTLKSVDEETRATLRAEAEPVVAWLQDESSSDDETNDE